MKEKRCGWASFFDNKRPVLLTLNYYRCAMLCSLQLNALTKQLKQLDWRPGKQFRMVTISIDPRETAELARDKRENYLKELGHGEVDWSFLVGSERNIESVASTVGFQFTFDSKTDQYAHPAVVFMLTPDGRVARYVYGIDYTVNELKFALVEASEGRLGSPLEKLILSCYRYDETRGRYTTHVMGDNENRRRTHRSRSPFVLAYCS